MKEVGDKFGSGELILPFVLQSAEVMKRAVAQLEQYLDKLEGHTKGTVVLATVFGDVHDIGKSLVNTILTNNGYTVVDLGKQVPIQTILDAAQEHSATAIGLSALLVSTSKQMPACIEELQSRGLSYPVLIGGAAINRAFGYRALYPGGPDSQDAYEAGVFYCKDAFEGLAVMDQLIDEQAHEALVEKLHTAAREFRESPVEVDTSPPSTDDSVRSGARTDAPVPTPPFWGVQEIPVELDEVYPHLDTHVLFKLHWGGRGKKGEEWRTLLREDFRPRLERMWREQSYLHPRALLGFFPCYALGNEIVVLDPEDRTTELTRLVCPRQRVGERICLADFFRPALDGAPPPELDVVALQAVTVGGEVTELLSRLEADGEYAEQLFVHGLGVQTAEALAEWLHSEIRRMLAIAPSQGRRYSWGYPAIPDQSEHLKVDRLLELSRIGMTITDGFAPDPEQSTLALVAHHPQAIYFGSRQGRLPAESSPDEPDRRRPEGPHAAGRARRRRPARGAGRGRGTAGAGRLRESTARLALRVGPPRSGRAARRRAAVQLVSGLVESSRGRKMDALSARLWACVAPCPRRIAVDERRRGNGQGAVQGRSSARGPRSPSSRPRPRASPPRGRSQSSASVSAADSCTLSSRQTRWPASGDSSACEEEALSREIVMPENHGRKAVTYKLTLTASGPAGTRKANTSASVAALPRVTGFGVSGITSEAATISAEVMPNGFQTTWEIWIVHQCKHSECFSEYPVAEGSLAAGFDSDLVEGSATELQPAYEYSYYFRLRYGASEEEQRGGSFHTKR